MHFSLTLKLILAFLVVSLAGTAIVALFAGRTTRTELDRLFLEHARANFIADATSHYQQTGSWDGVSEAIRRLASERKPPGPPPPGKPNPPPPGMKPRFILVDTSGRVIHSGPPYQVGDLIPASQLEQGTPIEFEDEVVGTVLSIDDTPQVDPREAEFLAHINQTLMYAAFGATAIALILGFVLARTLTRPLRELTAAARTVAQGNLEQHVPIRTRDELGELAVSFNRMSADLAQANRLRRQMTADIAHDLRSPLGVISGYIQSLRDGIFEPKEEIFDVIYTEIQHLQRLIEDLRTFSLADANELPLKRRPVAMQPFLGKLISAYTPQAKQKQIALRLKVISDLPEINIDPERMTQVLGNLVSNAFRYTPKDGEIALSAQAQAQAMLLKVQDTGSGIAPDDLPHIFERFYRVDKARQRDNGQSGLGLAIAKSIVEAHGGTISAESEPGRGTTFSIELPVSINGVN